MCLCLEFLKKTVYPKSGRKLNLFPFETGEINNTNHMLIMGHDDKLHMKFCEPLVVKVMNKARQKRGPFSQGATLGGHQNATIS